MKSILGQVVIAGLLAVATLSAHAAWRCQASDRHGNGWYVVSYSRYVAARGAMRVCRMNSYRPRSCGMDYCQPIRTRWDRDGYYYHHHRHGAWW